MNTAEKRALDVSADHKNLNRAVAEKKWEMKFWIFRMH